jgi:ATP-dependent DNA ligase
MHVEDHPFEYGDFEGVIPDGYGAGVVMLWDRGTWEPDVEDVGEELRKGDLKMRLDGYKLKGSWVLVRTRGGYGRAPATAPGASLDDGRSWLLIKHRDEWSSSQLDITDFAPLSVKTEFDFPEILEQDVPDVWISNKGARKTASTESLAKIVKKVEEYRKGKGRE